MCVCVCVCVCSCLGVVVASSTQMFVYTAGSMKASFLPREQQRGLVRAMQLRVAVDDDERDDRLQARFTTLFASSS